MESEICKLWLWAGWRKGWRGTFRSAWAVPRLRGYTKFNVKRDEVRYSKLEVTRKGYGSGEIWMPAVLSPVSVEDKTTPRYATRDSVNVVAEGFPCLFPSTDMQLNN